MYKNFSKKTTIKIIISTVKPLYNRIGYNRKTIISLLIVKKVLKNLNVRYKEIA